MGQDQGPQKRAIPGKVCGGQFSLEQCRLGCKMRTDTGKISRGQPDVATNGDTFGFQQSCQIGAEPGNSMGRAVYDGFGPSLALRGGSKHGAGVGIRVTCVMRGPCNCAVFGIAFHAVAAPTAAKAGACGAGHETNMARKAAPALHQLAVERDAAVMTVDKVK